MQADDVISGVAITVVVICVLTLAFIFGAMFATGSIRADCDAYGATDKLGDSLYECREVQR